MDHKKISLNPEDLKKLQALLRKEEEAVDAMSDEELDAAEKALEKRIKNLPDFRSGSVVNDKELIDTNWQKLQARLSAEPVASHSASSSEQKSENVIAFKAKKKSAPWATIGVLAAAALALLVFYPALRQNQNDPTDFGQTQTKGSAADGDYVYRSFCDVDVRAVEVNSLAELVQGSSYEVTAGEPFSISVSCDSQGFVQAWSKGAPALEIRDSQVPQNTRVLLMENGKDAEFTLEPGQVITLQLALTDKEIRSGANLFETPVPPTRIGEAQVLWTDSLTFREKK